MIVHEHVQVCASFAECEFVCMGGSECVWLCLVVSV